MFMLELKSPITDIRLFIYHTLTTPQLLHLGSLAPFELKFRRIPKWRVDEMG